MFCYISQVRNKAKIRNRYIIAFGVPLIATDFLLCLSESFLCHLQHTKVLTKYLKGNGIIIP